MLPACSLTPAVNYDNDYWIYAVEHNTEIMHPVSYTIYHTIYHIL